MINAFHRKLLYFNSTKHFLNLTKGGNEEESFFSFFAIWTRIKFIHKSTLRWKFPQVVIIHLSVSNSTSYNIYEKCILRECSEYLWNERFSWLFVASFICNYLSEKNVCVCECICCVLEKFCFYFSTSINVYHADGNLINISVVCSSVFLSSW